MLKNLEGVLLKAIIMKGSIQPGIFHMLWGRHIFIAKQFLRDYCIGA